MKNLNTVKLIDKASYVQ